MPVFRPNSCRVSSHDVMELTRFGGHLILGQEGVHNGEAQFSMGGGIRLNSGSRS